ncbi:MAG: potassium/proton antiporter [Actinomycetia bacterium]|nr:potassium/proton antiporter [Actinomycetes bacterium]
MSIDLLLLIGAVVVVVAVIVAKIGDRLGLPALLLFLLLGVLMEVPAEGALFNDSVLAHDLGFVALVIILADGGLSTKWRDIKPAVASSVLLATVAVGITIALVAGFAYLVLGVPLALAVLVAAIMAPTDSAAVFSVLRSVSLPPRVKAVLEGESGLNDAPTVLLVIAATDLAMGKIGYRDLPLAGLMIIVELIGGLALGAALGWLGVRLLRNLALPASGLYPLASLGWAIIAYGAGVVVHVSGFAAVYTCSVLLANGKLPHRHATRSFAEGIGWFAQIVLFVMLGMLSTPSRISLTIVVQAVILGLFLTFVARPISVAVVLTPSRIPWREQAFVSWAGLRGAVPIILATIPMSAGLPSANDLFDIIFVTVIVLTVLNAPSLPWVARLLDLVGDPNEVDIEVAPLDQVEADLLQLSVGEKSRLHGVSVAELRLPPNAQVSLVIRGDETFTPHGSDTLREGDELLLVTPSAVREQVEDQLRAIDRRGRLARWSSPEPT